MEKTGKVPVVTLNLNRCRETVEKTGNEHDFLLKEGDETCAVYQVPTAEQKPQHYSSYKLDGTEVIMHDMSQDFEPLAFPLFFMAGDPKHGWRLTNDDLHHMPGLSAIADSFKNVSSGADGKFMLFHRCEKGPDGKYEPTRVLLNPTLMGRKLSEMYILSNAMRSITQRVGFYSQHGPGYLKRQAASDAAAGERVPETARVPPASFRNGPSSKAQQLNDALAINARLAPDYFVTMTTTRSGRTSPILGDLHAQQV